MNNDNAVSSSRCYTGWYLRQKPVGGSKAGGLPLPSLSPFPPLPLSIPPKFSDKPVGGKVRSSDGEVPRLHPPPPYKYHPAVTHSQRHSTISSTTVTLRSFYTCQDSTLPDVEFSSTGVDSPKNNHVIDTNVL